jgi:hypothetical protein
MPSRGAPLGGQAVLLLGYGIVPLRIDIGTGKDRATLTCDDSGYGVGAAILGSITSSCVACTIPANASSILDAISSGSRTAPMSMLRLTRTSPLYVTRVALIDPPVRGATADRPLTRWPTHHNSMGGPGTFHATTSVP